MGIVESEKKESYAIAREFWDCLAEQKWDQVKELLSDDFEAVWPQSREIMDATGFIEVNKNYPGSHKIKVINMSHEYDNWDRSSSVITQTYIQSEMPDGKSAELYAVSFFKITDDENGEKKITGLTEYWVDTYPAPEWRSQWVKIFDKRELFK